MMHPVSACENSWEGLGEAPLFASPMRQRIMTMKYGIRVGAACSASPPTTGSSQGAVDGSSPLNIKFKSWLCHGPVTILVVTSYVSDFVSSCFMLM
jgi:hypothetical protein